jgi:hypothetical protein
MKHPVAVLVLVFPLAIASARAVFSAPATALTKPTLPLSDARKGGLVPLPDGSVLLWVDDGRIQIKGPTGLRSPIIPLGVNSVWQVVPDDVGVLGWGTRDAPTGQLQGSIFLVDAKGSVVQRWEPSPSFVFSIASKGGRRWATISGELPPRTREAHFDPRIQTGPVIDLLVELLPGGKIEERGKVEMGAHVAAFVGGKNGRGRVDCVPADLTKTTYHYPYCTVAETGGWRATGLWDNPPLACGSYLIEVLDQLAGSDLPHRNKHPQVVVRRLDTGEAVNTKPLARGQAVACGSPGELLIGRQDIRGLSLPDLKPLWDAPSPGGRVVALARGQDRALWVATSSMKVVRAYARGRVAAAR